MLVASALGETLDRAKQETGQEAGLQTVALFAFFYFERATCLATSPSGAARAGALASGRTRAADVTPFDFRMLRGAESPHSYLIRIPNVLPSA
jgi:hypothetical protein